MRIMIDTNVMNAFIDLVLSQYQIVLTSYIIDELKAVVSKKFPAKFVEIYG
jgi:hypothetical protein